MEININKRELLLVIGSFLLPVIFQVWLLIYQYTEVKVVTAWSVIATVLFVLIFLNAIRINVWAKVPDDPTTVAKHPKLSSEYPAKRRVKTNVIFAIIMAVLFGLSALFFSIHNKNVSGLEVVNAEVVWQEGKVVTTTEVDEGEITETEYREINVLVKYSYNGQERTAALKGNTVSKIHVSELKIYVDQSGACVTDYGRILVWKIVAIICLSCAALTLLMLVLRLGTEFFAGGIMCSIGLVIMFVVGCQFIENMWFNDMVCFASMFVNAGLSILIFSVLNLIIPKRHNKVVTINIEKRETTEESNAELVQDTNFEIEAKPETKHCAHCGSELLEGANFCDSCGAKIEKE